MNSNASSNGPTQNAVTLSAPTANDTIDGAAAAASSNDSLMTSYTPVPTASDVASASGGSYPSSSSSSFTSSTSSTTNTFSPADLPNRDAKQFQLPDPYEGPGVSQLSRSQEEYIEPAMHSKNAGKKLPKLANPPASASYDEWEFPAAASSAPKTHSVVRKRQKRKQNKNETDVVVTNLSGYKGNKNLDEILSFLGEDSKKNSSKGKSKKEKQQLKKQQKKQQHEQQQLQKQQEEQEELRRKQEEELLEQTNLARIGHTGSVPIYRRTKTNSPSP